MPKELKLLLQIQSGDDTEPYFKEGGCVSTFTKVLHTTKTEAALTQQRLNKQNPGVWGRYYFFPEQQNIKPLCHPLKGMQSAAEQETAVPGGHG